MKTTITFHVDGDTLGNFTDEHIAQLWHIAQANPAPFGDSEACHFADEVGDEIIRRWLKATPPSMFTHRAMHLINDEGNAS